MDPRRALLLPCRAMSQPRPLVGPWVVGLLLALTLGAPAWSLAQSASGPLVSPDGKSIVFTREPARGNPVHVIAHIDGSNERVLATTPLNRIQWLGDSRRLVFQKTRGREGVTLEVIPAGGGEPKPFGRLPGEVEAVSPDGTWAVSLLGEWPTMRLSRVYLDGTSEKPLVTGQGVGLGWLVDVETGARRKLAAHDDRPYLDETPSYLADGRIAIQSNRTGRMEVWIIGVDGSAIQITRNPQSSAQLQFPPEPRNDSRGRFG